MPNDAKGNLLGAFVRIAGATTAVSTANGHFRLAHAESSRSLCNVNLMIYNAEQYMGNIQPIQPLQPTPNLARGTIRQFQIGSCSLKSEDLRRLYKLLEKRAQEAASEASAALRQMPGQTAEQLQEMKNNLVSLLRLVVIVNASTGEWTSSPSDEALSDSLLPDSITQIVYDSAFLFRNQIRLEPPNALKVVIDFSKTSVLDLTNLWITPNSNSSSAWISGSNDAWVKAVHDDLKNFFGQRSTLRGWLYSRYAYDILLWLFGIPTSLALVYRIDRWTKLSVSPGSVRVPLYVALFALGLLIFRFIFNYAKWAFPAIEPPNRRGWPAVHRSILAIVWVSVVSLFVESVAKALHII